MVSLRPRRLLPLALPPPLLRPLLPPLLLPLLLPLALLPSPGRGRSFAGSIQTSAPWAHLAHFAFQAERSHIVYRMPEGGAEASGSTFAQQMGRAEIVPEPDRGVFSLEMHYPYGARLSLLAYFDDPPRSGVSSGGSFDMAQTWEQVRRAGVVF